FVKAAMDKFGFLDYEAELSTRPDKFIGEKEDWDNAEIILEDVLKKKEFSYKINPKDGAFYGPKIDIKLKDALGREWQCATVQLDYNIPKRFDLTYRKSDGGEERVVMLHRVILGSLERFFATLIEHYAGKFPLWLAPVQISVLNVSEDTKGYANKVKELLQKEGFRTEVSIKDDTLQKKIREKELLKVPYMVIVGNREKEEGTIALRKQGMKNLGTMKVEDLVDVLKKEIIQT
ncbi:MAG: threonine--tRNA ligase, partial [Candidatus Omnitrophica bacterium]|nr:threonine--tRNA ligase [Candidatus Omnitrophota bacterium]